MALPRLRPLPFRPAIAILRDFPFPLRARRYKSLHFPPDQGRARKARDPAESPGPEIAGPAGTSAGSSLKRLFPERDFRRLSAYEEKSMSSSGKSPTGSRPATPRTIVSGACLAAGYSSKALGKR